MNRVLIAFLCIAAAGGLGYAAFSERWLENQSKSNSELMADLTMQNKDDASRAFATAGQATLGLSLLSALTLLHVVRRVMGAAERATRMIRDLLDYTQARLGGGIPIEVKALDMHEHVLSVTEDLLHSHSARELRLHHEGDTRGEWDPDRVAQIVTNLVDNAFKYSPAGTPVTVRSRGEGNDVVLEVRNEGAPIAAERISELFKPLSRGSYSMRSTLRALQWSTHSSS